MSALRFTCEECDGKGVDSGSLNEPEPCRVCLGSGSQLIEFDTRSSHYAVRKPAGRALPQRVTAGEMAERKFRFGGGA
jgi:hypothetical protein